MTKKKDSKSRKLQRCSHCGYIGEASYFIAGDPADPILICPDCRSAEIVDWGGKQDIAVPIDLLFLLLGVTEKCLEYDNKVERKTGQMAAGWSSHHVLKKLYNFMHSESLIRFQEEGEE
jgi:hypothetical protein